MNLFGTRIHAFLPSEPRIEFGAITPKGHHLSLNIAGKTADAQLMKSFLACRPVRDALPFSPACLDTLDGSHFFKGRFPISTARGYYGDRYVVVGDAAGLVRAFKGKGINSACLSGLWAAEVMLTQGISHAAFAQHYRKACRDILADLPYGRAVRRLVSAGRRLSVVDLVLHAAEHETAFREALFDAVSGRRNYRHVIHSLCRIGGLSRAVRGMLCSR